MPNCLNSILFTTGMAYTRAHLIIDSIVDMDWVLSIQPTLIGSWDPIGSKIKRMVIRLSFIIRDITCMETGKIIFLMALTSLEYNRHCFTLTIIREEFRVIF